MRDGDSRDSRGRSGRRGDGRDNGRGDNRGRGGRRNGGRNGRGRGGDNRGRGGRGGYRGRSNHRRQDPRAASRSGNRRERIAVESGYLVLIDQFMLANKQFSDKVLEVIDEEPNEKNAIIKSYGGTVVELEPGTYRIDRDPYAYTIVIHADGERVDSKEAVDEAGEKNVGSVYVDTRCLAMFDRELLDDSALLDKYRSLWASGDEKACRDLLRDNGGAVRYGFSRYGDELGVYSLEDQDVVCLWPDVAEAKKEAESSEKSEEVAQAAE